MAAVMLSIQEAVRDLTADLFGKGTAVEKASDPIEPEDVGAVVSYRSDDGNIAAVAIVDKNLVGIFGAALVLVPEVALREAQRVGRLPENLYENFWEVANIMASLLNRAGYAHTVLADRERSLDGITDDMRAVIENPAKQRRFFITVEGYGTGRVQLMSA